jgi:hypothetical protein
LEEDKIGLKMKVCLSHKVSIDERKKGTVDVLIVDEILASFCSCINNRRGKLINKQCINEEETNLANTQCIREKGRSTFDM